MVLHDRIEVGIHILTHTHTHMKGKERDVY